MHNALISKLTTFNPSNCISKSMLVKKTSNNVKRRKNVKCERNSFRVGIINKTNAKRNDQNE